jgi:hypothetical protein
MRLRAQMQQAVERLSVVLGMPTRSELNSIGERLQALRREVRAQRGGDALIDEIAGLRGELEALKAAVKSPRAAVTREVPARTVIVEPVVAKPAKEPKAKHKARKAPAPAQAAAPKRARRGAKAVRAERAVAAVAPGNFASRIAKFADASLGSKRRKKDPVAAKASDGKRKKKH